jgi:hypothetical protein
MQVEESERMAAKTAEQRFLNVLTQEFEYAPKIAQVILEEAQACLLGPDTGLRVGQMRKILLKRAAAHGAPLEQGALVEVTWTIDAGAEDYELAQRGGAAALRRTRIQRLAEEALSQGGVASQEDLAQALQVSVRTIKRDCAYLARQGILVPTRGKLQGIGRGQTHKAQIVGQWLRGATYDQITQRTHHSLTCIRRYIQAFARVINLQEQGLSIAEISLALQMSGHLVQEYLAVYAQNDTRFCRERLQEQLTRLTGGAVSKKSGVNHAA